MTGLLDMTGCVDGTFQSTPATRTSKAGGSYVDGRWVEGTPTQTSHVVTLQGASQREIDFILNAGERVVDVRKVYINDNSDYSYHEADTWVFDGVDGIFKVISMDNRPWRTYIKLMVSRLDDAT